MKNKLLLVLTFFLLAHPVQAQFFPATGSSSDKSPPTRDIMPQTIKHKPNAVAPVPEIGQKIETFFKSLNQKDYAGAYQTFLAGSHLAAQNDKISAFISKTQEAFELYGPLYDDEVFDNYTVGSNVLVLTYLSRHTLQPLRWRFIFYRPGVDSTGHPSDAWILINLGFDDYLLDELD